MTNRLDLTHAPLAHYRFYLRTLEDFSGHCLDLYGSHGYREVAPQEFELAPGSDVSRPVRDALLAITGPITIEVVGRLYSTPGLLTFAAFLATGESLATNVQWLLGTQDSARLRWLQEFGSSGTDSPSSPLAAVTNEVLPAPGVRFIMTGVRHTDGSVSIFIDGRLHARSAPLTTPAGGTTALLRVMMGATAFGLEEVKIIGSALTPAEVAAEAELVLGAPPITTGKAWVGALTDTSATVVCRMAGPVPALSLLVNGTPTAPVATDTDHVARFELTGLDADTEYVFELPCGLVGGFKTAPVAAGQPSNFTIAFSGDHDTGSTHPVFDAILATEPLQVVLMGDIGYPNITSNTAALFHANYDANLASPPQHRLYRNVPTQHMWDDHDGAGGNDSNGSAAAWPAAAAAYRSREPHYPLPHARACYQTWDICRVRFIMTDLRSEASANSATDDSSKTMLGATQKAWFKDLVANSPGMLLVWICSRWFANANHSDAWNNFSTERAELVDFIKANAHGRVVVLSADKHSLGIDDGSHVDHATGGGEPLPTFQAAPLDRPGTALSGTYSHGEFNGVGQFGTMEIEDSGADIDVTWRGHDATGAVLTTHSFSVSV